MNSTIRFWKGFLSTEIGNLDSNEELSALFNAIIFTRAIEDNYKRIQFERTGQRNETEILVQACLAPDVEFLTLSAVLSRVLISLGQNDIPDHLVNWELLRVFDNLTAETVVALLRNFYRIRGVRLYEYDFSVMSKHALSRIYERYVSILRVEEVSEWADFLLFFSARRGDAKEFRRSLYPTIHRAFLRTLLTRADASNCFQAS